MSQAVTLSPNRYAPVAVWLHWIIAVLILANIALGLSADHLPDDLVRPIIDLHKSIGLTALGLVLMRILWRLSHKPPPLPRTYPRWERAVAHIAHLLLYGLILLIPVSGWIHDSAFKDAAAHPLRLFWTIPWFRIPAIANLPPAPKEALHSRWFAIHAWSAFALLAMLALHILGALKHQLIDRERELQRMSLRH